MRLRTKGDGVKAADRAIAEYNRQAEDMGAEQGTLASDRKAVETELEGTWTEAAEALLPSADPATLSQVGGGIGWPQLPKRRPQLEARRSDWAARLQTIERDSSFRNRARLLEPERGTIAVQRAQIEQAMGQVDEALEKFEIEQFQWLRNRELKKQIWGGFDSFMHAVTFGGFRETRAQKKCCQELGYETWEALQADVQKHNTQKNQLERRKDELDAYKKTLEALVEEHGQLFQWVHHFESMLLSVLRRELAVHLSSRDPLEVRPMVPAALRPLFAKAHALTKKLDYLENMGRYLGTEIADRKKRIGAITSVRQKWRAKPWDSLQGDKTKWLVNLPKAKKASTKKRVRWVRSMHEAVYDYDDYDAYDGYLEQGDFLAYDAFAYGYEDRVPYEGFSRTVIEELEERRTAENQEKADYSFFKETDKNLAAMANEAPAEPGEGAPAESISEGSGISDEALAVGIVGGAVVTATAAHAAMDAKAEALAAASVVDADVMAEAS